MTSFRTSCSLAVALVAGLLLCCRCARATPYNDTLSSKPHDEGPSNIPKAFSVDIEYLSYPIPMIEFYNATLHAILYMSHLKFDFMTSGFMGQERQPMSLSVRSSRTPAFLRVCDVIWAMQRVAERLRSRGRYTEVDGVVKDYISNRLSVGLYKARHRNMGRSSSDGLDRFQSRDWTNEAAAQQNSAGALGHKVANSTTYRGPVLLERAITSENVDSAGLNTTTLSEDDPWVFKVYPLTKSHPAPDVFVMLIRSMARIAESDAQERVRRWLYRDHELRMICEYVPFTAERLVTYEQVSLGFALLARYMVDFKYYGGLMGTWYWKEKESGLGAAEGDELLMVGSVSIMTDEEEQILNVA